MKKILCSFVALNVLICGTASAGDNTVWDLFHGAPKIKDADGNDWKVRGRVLWDIADLSETPVGGPRRDINDTEFRTVRIGVEGQYEKFKYKAELDFAGSQTTFKAVNMTWKGPIVLKVGQMKAGGSLEEETSSLHTSFIERGMVTDGVGFDRRLGIQLAKYGKNYGVNAGIYGNSINGAKDGTAANTVLAARGYYAPVLTKDNVIHLGVFARHTKKIAGAPSRSVRWGPHLATEKIQPVIGGDALLLGLETAAVSGRFHAQAEFLNEDGDLGTAKGGFIQAGVFLTGETRAYKGGKFNRTNPKNPLSKGGYGAWEIAARFDTLDANKGGDEKVDAYTLGLTWYPESHLRLRLNYTDANGDNFTADGLYMRLQVDW